MMSAVVSDAGHLNDVKHDIKRLFIATRFVQI